MLQFLVNLNIVACEGAVCLFSPNDIIKVREINSTVFELNMLLSMASPKGSEIDKKDAETIIAFWKQSAEAKFKSSPRHSVTEKIWKNEISKIDRDIDRILSSNNNLDSDRLFIDNSILSLYDTLGVPAYFYYLSKLELTLFMARRHLYSALGDELKYDVSLLKEYANKYKNSFIKYRKNPEEKQKSIIEVKTDSAGRLHISNSGVAPIYDYTLYVNLIDAEKSLSDLDKFVVKLVKASKKVGSSKKEKMNYLNVESAYSEISEKLWKFMSSNPSYPVSIFDTGYLYKNFKKFKM